MANTITLPDLRKIRINDPLFSHYAGKVAKKMIPVQWDILNGKGSSKCFCIDNFRVAAGELDAPHRGVVFGDTDAYKWLEAVAFCAGNGEEDFLPQADSLIDLLERAQQKDGYLNTYFTVCHPELRWKNLAEGHELYSAGHLIEAAVAYYNATGKRKLLDIAIRFADLICKTFGEKPNQIPGYPGHQEIELALIKLWSVTGTQQYLDTARYFLNRRGTEPNYFLEEMKQEDFLPIFPELQDYDPSYSQSHLPPWEQTTAEGHAVRAMYQLSAMADLAEITQDPALRKSCQTLWDNITGKRMYVTGGIGSSGHLERFTVDYDLPNDRMYCESCASIGLMMVGQRMNRLTKDASFYEVVERALYNTVLAGVSAEGDRYFYVNPLEVWPDNCREHTSMAHVKPVRQPWFEVACCPANIARTLASLGQYVYAQDERSLYINLLIGSSYETVLRDTRLRVTLRNELLSGGSLVLDATSEGTLGAMIRLRLPKWLEAPKITLNGETIHPAVENGYAVLAVGSPGEHRFCLTGDVRVHTLSANIRVRADVGKTALQRGPFVYCAEQCDNGENLAALRVNPEPEAIAVLPPEDNLPGSIPTLSMPGKRIVRTQAGEQGLYGDSCLKTEETHIRAVPYAFWGNREPGEMRVWLDAIL